MRESNTGSALRRVMARGQLAEAARNHPLIFAGVATAAIMALATVAFVILIAAFNAADSEDQGGSGAGGAPPPELVAVLNTLPVYPGASITDLASGVGASTGHEVGTAYAVEDEPEEVIDFYEGVVSALGWQLDGERRVVTAANSGDGSSGVIASFTRDNLRLDIVARTGTKDPSLGHTVVSLNLLELY